jgi:signal transduction histidine kinase/ActR/RegA family two-component response regulator
MTIGLINRWRRLPQAATIIAVILVVLGVVAIGRAEEDYRDHEQSEARVEAAIIAANVAAALDFNDRAAAEEAVRALRVNKRVRRVAVYDAKNALFAGYHRADAPPPPARLSEARRVSKDNTIGEQLPVMRAENQIGTVVVVSDLEPVSRRLLRYALTALLVVLAALVVTVLGLGQRALRRANQELVRANEELRAEIEQRERAEGQLRQAQKMESLGQLTGGIAHDFNNMLAIVIGNLDMAVRRIEAQPGKALKGMEHALEGAMRAATLTRRLLAFSRRQPLEPQPLDANKLVGGMSELLRRTLGEQVRVETVLAGGLWRICVDPGQLENAVLNLCVNARDAMADGGRLTIETLNASLDDDYAAHHDDAVAGQFVVIAVSDTGPGMSPEIRERAFDPFFTTKDVGKGTGLGLSQVYGFVRQSGGHVKIYSEPGAGATVKVYLPRYFGPESGEAHRRDTDDASEAPRAIAGEAILVVEDEEQVRRISADALRDLGYAVVEAGNGAEALQHLRHHAPFDLLFTDVVMPDLNGRQLVDMVRVQWPEMRVLYTTGYTRNAIVHNGVLDPDVDLLTKPFTVQQLARKVRAVLDAPPPEGTDPGV